MHDLLFTLIFFFYGLAFFCMGLITVLEIGRCSNDRLRHGLRYLAAFGLLHGTHEWFEMFQGLDIWHALPDVPVIYEALRLILLALSFLALGAFGSLLIAPNEKARRLSMLGPLGATTIWAAGLFIFRSYYPLNENFINIIDVWTRYILAIPAALLACVGLIVQQREFRLAGMAQFGRDSLWAAIAFAWYGLIGQAFTRPSPLPPSTFFNSDLFLQVFGFPIQLLRAVAAIVVALFVIRFFRSFEVETQRKIAGLQLARLEEAQRREALRGELLRRVVAAQEAERQRIARELHDETGQALTALGLGLRGVTATMRQDPEKAGGRLRQLEGMVAHSLVELQRLIADLRPSHLDDLGLPATLRWYCSEIQSRATIDVSTEITGEIREIPAELKTALFRIAQEALTNVVKHSQATAIKVALNYQEKSVLLIVEDNGCGFDLDNLAQGQRTSWGLLGMEERASLVGGELSISSAPNQGTRVQVKIPYSDRFEEVNHENSPAVSG